MRTGRFAKMERRVLLREVLPVAHNLGLRVAGKAYCPCKLEKILSLGVIELWKFV